MSGSNTKLVCVTGAGGYIASWLVKYLLDAGYHVRGTVRDPDDEKNLHLKSLDGAQERLTLYKADLLDYDAVLDAIKGCGGVFHTASPVPPIRVSNPEDEMINPCVEGAQNVLKASFLSKVERVVMTSSISAVLANPNLPKDKPRDETCWSDPEYCRKNQDWYFLSKTISEQNALNYSKDNGLDVITICPSTVLGPLLQQKMNASSLILLRFLNGDREKCENRLYSIVDVRDVAKAHILTYETSAAFGRYLCSAYDVELKELINIMRTYYPEYSYPKEIVDSSYLGPTVNSNKIQELGLNFMPLEQTLKDTIESFRERGDLK